MDLVWRSSFQTMSETQPWLLGARPMCRIGTKHLCPPEKGLSTASSSHASAWAQLALHPTQTSLRSDWPSFAYLQPSLIRPNKFAVWQVTWAGMLLWDPARLLGGHFVDQKFCIIWQLLGCCCQIASLFYVSFRHAVLGACLSDSNLSAYIQKSRCSWAKPHSRKVE